LKNEIKELIKAKKVIRDGKYYSAPEDHTSYARNDHRHRRYGKTPASPDHRSENIFTGIVDFGRDGRLTVKAEDRKLGNRNFKIVESSGKSFTAGEKVHFKILVEKGAKRKIEYAEIVKVLGRNTISVVGKFEDRSGYGIVYPESREIKNEIYISKNDFNNARDGDKVYCEIINYDKVQKGEDPEGKIIEILGRSGEKDAEENAIIKKFALEQEFPAGVMHEAENIKYKKEVSGRLDLRNKICFTIDPEDAKDFDDAVSVETLENGNYRVGIHIADVSHYVKENTALDKEAIKRATSVYLVKNVIPMLPEKLSNNICSLMPGKERLTFSVMIDLNKNFKIKDYFITKSIIKSARRFSYEEAQDVIDTGKGDYAKELSLLNKIANVLTKKRLKEESLDFESQEVRFIFDKNNDIKEIVVKIRLGSMRLIEEFMLLANKCVTEFVKKLQKEKKIFYPFVYRVHDTPDPDKLNELSEFVKQFGYSIDIINKNSLRKLLNDIEGKPEEFIINNLLIRSMAKAIYTHKNIGHYGLGFADYTHFTSPIRRYPDLIVHRMLFDYISENNHIQKRIEHYRRILPDICRHCSQKEQNAVNAERESVKLKQVEYISKHIGDEFEGIIAGIMKYGMFIEIMDIMIEGMVRFRDIEDDYYEFDMKKHLAVGKRRGKTYRAGDKVRVKVIRVSKENKKVDFVLL
jgi:ribonuclease R